MSLPGVPASSAGAELPASSACPFSAAPESEAVGDEAVGEFSLSASAIGALANGSQAEPDLPDQSRLRASLREQPWALIISCSFWCSGRHTPVVPGLSSAPSVASGEAGGRKRTPTRMLKGSASDDAGAESSTAANMRRCLWSKRQCCS